MKLMKFTGTLTAFVIAAMLIASAPVRAQDDQTGAKALRKQIDELTMPVYDANRDKAEPDYRANFIKQRQEIMEKRCELIGHLFAQFPTADETAELLGERWTSLARNPEGQKTVQVETQTLIDKYPDHRALKDAYYCRALGALYAVDNAQDTKAAVDHELECIAQLHKQFPDDTRAATLTYQLASYFVTDDEQALSLFRQIKNDYPESAEARRVDGKIRQYESIGKPFELAFTDAISGSEISMEQLRGKVVVIDFWATWCGPCVAEMPNMKKLYAQFKPKGVEFLGISLDQAENKDNPEEDGLLALKKFVKDNDIQWPQYYQGNYWQSEFSSSWGINSIPCLFVVDAQGNLFSVSARGRLEEMIPELIARRDAKTGG